jgi:pantoate--beta-alanine ligase
MGFLHAGHVSLIRRARREGGLVVVSIYVNPAQFGPKEDFARYPRNMHQDLAILRKEKAAAVFAPKNLYTAGASMSVDPGPMQKVLCGRFRPGHFRGVATVVAKLFNIVEPDTALFGQKDAQQFAILQRMVRELDLPVKMVDSPTVREKDGLAMSSRNAYLTGAERRLAPSLYRALLSVKAAYRSGARSAGAVLRIARKIPMGRVQYLEAVDQHSLLPVKTLRKGVLVAGAMTLGKTRLIDNIII